MSQKPTTRDLLLAAIQEVRALGALQRGEFHVSPRSTAHRQPEPKALAAMEVALFDKCLASIDRYVEAKIDEGLTAVRTAPVNRSGFRK